MCLVSSFTTMCHSKHSSIMRGSVQSQTGLDDEALECVHLVIKRVIYSSQCSHPVLRRTRGNVSTQGVRPKQHRVDTTQCSVRLAVIISVSCTQMYHSFSFLSFNAKVLKLNTQNVELNILLLLQEQLVFHLNISFMLRMKNQTGPPGWLLRAWRR